MRFITQGDVGILSSSESFCFFSVSVSSSIDEVVGELEVIVVISDDDLLESDKEMLSFILSI